MKSKENKNIIITGASRGLGAEMSYQWCDKGHNVVGIARSEGSLAQVKERCDKTSGSFQPISADVTDTISMEEAVKRILREWKHVDIAVANAGIATPGWASKQSVDQIQDIMAVNFMGMVHLFSPIIPVMIEQGEGTLAGISSIAAYRGLPALSAYAASKAAMNNYLETLRVELRRKGIFVSTICPGYIDTDMTRQQERPMPFKISVEKAARESIRAIEGGKIEALFPLPMALTASLLNFLPNRLYDLIIRYF